MPATRGPGLLGPVFALELVGLARHGWAAIVRSVYGLLLLVVLFAVYLEWVGPRVSPADAIATQKVLQVSELARFAGSFVNAFLMVQLAAVLLLTPVVVAGAVAGERERQTLSVLLTTDLRSHEIVLGKLAARLLHLVGLVLAGLPVLSLLQLWGGVDATVLLVGFAAAGLTVLSLGSLTLLYSVHARDATTAALRPFIPLLIQMLLGSCLPISVSGSPVAFFLEVRDVLRGGGGGIDELVRELQWFAIWHGTATVVFLFVAVRRLRQWPADRLPPVGPAPPGSLSLGVPSRPGDAAALLDAQPLLWKELYSNRVIHLGLVATIAVVLSTAILLSVGIVLGIVALGALLTSRPAGRELIAGTIVAVGLPLLAGLLVGVGLRAARSVSRERDRQTLDSLLLLPTDRDDLLYAKWWGSVRKPRRLWLTLGGLWLLGVLTMALHPVTAVLLAAAAGVEALLVASVGLWLSVYCRTARSATFAAGVALLAVAGGPWLAWRCVRALFPETLGPNGWEGLTDLIAVGLTPPVTWWTLLTSHPRAPDEDTVAAVAVGLAVQVLVAWALWVFACDRFEAEGRA